MKEVKGKIIYGSDDEPFRVDKIKFYNGYSIDGIVNVEEMILDVGVTFTKTCDKCPDEIIFRWTK